MLEPISTFFASVFGLFKGWLDGRQAIQKADQERQLAALQNQARLLLDNQNNNHSWEMAQLTDSDRVLRRICFFIFSFPFLYAVLDPQAVQVYFETALSAIPEWYIKTYMGIVGAVWGISSLKNAIPQIIHLIRKK
jgi:hypothetical protein